jgi:glucose-6-phosphate isomerase
VEKFHSTVKIPKIFKDPDMDFIQGKSFNELISAEKKGTEKALTESKRPNYTIKLPNVSEETVGELIYFWELVTAYSGKLYNVNAFNQPGVEAGKVATREILSKK